MDFVKRVDLINKKLVLATLEQILGKFMSTYIDNDIVIPVVVGGSNLRRCAFTLPASKILASKLKVNDIDIKFLIKPKIRENDPLLQKVDVIRREFILKLITHPLFVSTVEGLEQQYGVNIITDLFTKYADAQAEETDPGWVKRVYRVQLVKLSLIYQDPKTAEQERVDFVDTTIISNLSEAIVYKMYQSVFKTNKLLEKKVTVPVYVQDGVIYATCAWNYLDTVRMLVYYSSVLTNKVPSDENGNHYLLISIKYMVKFIVMYIQLNNISIDDPKWSMLKDIFRKGKRILQSLLEKQINKRDANDEVDQKLLGIIRALRTNLSNHTNLESLVKAFTYKTNCHKINTLLNSTTKAIKRCGTK
jgi:hypothetical protein